MFLSEVDWLLCWPCTRNTTPFGTILIRFKKHTRAVSGNAKQYGTWLTSMPTRAINLELPGELSTDSFIQALWRYNFFINDQANLFTSDSNNMHVHQCLSQNVIQWRNQHVNQWLGHDVHQWLGQKVHYWLGEHVNQWLGQHVHQSLGQHVHQWLGQHVP